MWRGRPTAVKNSGIQDLSVHFMIPGDIRQRTGGYIYDKEIITSLLHMGCSVTVHEVANDFPYAQTESIEQCREVFRSIPDNGMIVVDGLVGSAVGSLIRENAQRLIIVLVIHLPLSLRPWGSGKLDRALLSSEKTALHYSDVVIVTSESARSALLHDPFHCDGEKVLVIEPGWENMGRKKSYRKLPQRLLCVANIIERKGYLTLVEALGRLRDLKWTLTCCGNMDDEPSHVRCLLDKVEEEGLRERIHLKGVLQQDELADAYLGADLFVLPSLYETYGMALTEASGYGLPIITSVDPATNRHLSKESTLFLSPGNAEALAETLVDLMSSPARYKQLCSAAKEHRPSSRSWPECAEHFFRVLNCAAKVNSSQ